MATHFSAAWPSNHCRNLADVSDFNCQAWITKVFQPWQLKLGVVPEENGFLSECRCAKTQTD